MQHSNRLRNFHRDRTQQRLSPTLSACHLLVRLYPLVRNCINHSAAASPLRHSGQHFLESPLFFEHPLRNPFNHEERFRIDLDDHQLRVVTGTAEWAYLRRSVYYNTYYSAVNRLLGCPATLASLPSSMHGTPTSVSRKAIGR